MYTSILHTINHCIIRCYKKQDENTRKFDKLNPYLVGDAGYVAGKCCDAGRYISTGEDRDTAGFFSGLRIVMRLLVYKSILH